METLNEACISQINKLSEKEIKKYYMKKDIMKRYYLLKLKQKTALAEDNTVVQNAKDSQ